MGQHIRLLKAAGYLAVVFALLLTAVWPWSPPEVDWRTPLETALQNGDCRTAVAILDAAVRAGSTEAMRLRPDVAARSRCYEGLPPTHGDAAKAERAMEARGAGPYATIERLYQLDQVDLGYLRGNYVASVIFLCAAPYNALQSVDGTELSKTVLRNDASPTLVFHRERRRICVRILEQLAAGLIASPDAASREVAANLLTFKPSLGDDRSGVLLAKLFLELEFVRRANAGSDPTGARQRILDQDAAWRALERAAEARNEEAVRMMVAFLHDGRFRARDDKEAYFWLLRLRRLGQPDEPDGKAVESALSEAERSEVVLRERSLRWPVSAAR